MTDREMMHNKMQYTRNKCDSDAVAYLDTNRHMIRLIRKDFDPKANFSRWKARSDENDLNRDETILLLLDYIIVYSGARRLQFLERNGQMNEEARLLWRLKHGDEAALEVLIRRLTPYLSTVIFRAGGNALSREDQEELLSDVFVALWKNANHLNEEEGSIRAYLAATARHGVYQRLRNRQETVALEEMAERGDEPSTEDPDRLSLWNAVASLGEEDFELFVRFYRYGQSLREIAKAMDMKLPTVKTRLSRGRQKLKHLLLEAEEVL